MSIDKTTLTISGLTTLGVVFIVLKLCHVINWSWWFVTAPFSLMVVAGAILIMMFIIALWGTDDSDLMEDYF